MRRIPIPVARAATIAAPAQAIDRPRRDHIDVAPSEALSSDRGPAACRGLFGARDTGVLEKLDEAPVMALRSALLRTCRPPRRSAPAANAFNLSPAPVWLSSVRDDAYEQRRPGSRRARQSRSSSASHSNDALAYGGLCLQVEICLPPLTPQARRFRVQFSGLASRLRAPNDSRPGKNTSRLAGGPQHRSRARSGTCLDGSGTSFRCDSR